MAGRRWTGKRCRLLCMLSLTFSFFLVEIIVGLITNSMALVADSFHMLSDVIALLVGYFAIKLARSNRGSSVYEMYRMETVGALINAVFLISLCFLIFLEAMKRFLLEDEHIDNPQLILIVGSIGLFLNIIGLFLFHGHGHSHSPESAAEFLDRLEEDGDDDDNDDPLPLTATAESNAKKLAMIKGSQKSEFERLTHEKEVVSPAVGASVTGNSVGSAAVTVADGKSHSHSHGHSHGQEGGHLNMQGVFLHVLGDALGSVFIIVSALVIWKVQGHWRFYIDPALSLLLIAIMLSTAIPLLRRAVMSLLQVAPPHLQSDVLQRKLLEKIPAIESIPLINICQHRPNYVTASVTVRCHSVRDYLLANTEINSYFAKLGITHVTVQPEKLQDAVLMPHCLHVCNSCGAATYCRAQVDKTVVASLGSPLDVLPTVCDKLDGAIDNHIEGACCTEKKLATDQSSAVESVGEHSGSGELVISVEDDT